MMLKRRRFSKVCFFILALWIALVMVMPFYWALSLSFRMPKDSLAVTGLGIPFLHFEPTIENWRHELRTSETQQALVNSLVIAIGTAIAVTVLGTPAAYALARFRFRRPKNEDISFWFLSQRVLPPIATALPFYILIVKMGLHDTRLALIMLNTTFNLPFVIVIMRQAFLELPIELEEAALVDGASHLGVFLQISLRLAAPSLAASILIVIAFTWNEFLFGLLIGDVNARVIPVHMAAAVGTRGPEYWYIAPRSLIAILPPVVLALLAQRYIVRGLTLGGVKG